MLVDDDEIARMSLSNIVFRIAGVSGVVEAEDGEQAWALLEGGLRPALCCCDIRMPRLDGLGVLQRIRSHPVLRQLPVVLISSASDRETVQSAIASGVAGYILKPFLAVQTQATLERVLVDRLATEAEPVHVTRRRLAMDSDNLQRVLRKLRDDAASARAKVDDAGSGDDHQRRLLNLHSGAVLLGLWRGAGLLNEAIKDPSPAMHRQILDELARLVDVQLAASGPQPA